MKTRRHSAACSALALAFAAGLAHAQSFTESFDDVSTLEAAGWYVQNNSNPLGPSGWSQGSFLTFPSWGGAGYIAANWENTLGGGTISNWLVTPQVNISNGNQVRFWTRAPISNFPDRLEVRMSSSGSSTNVGTAAEDVGDFTTLLETINPDLQIGGYPTEWTQYTLTVSGLGSPTSGRFAFRYFVPDSGSSGTAGDYIGIDEFQYSTTTINTGACIYASGCDILSAAECAVLGGTYEGNNTQCPGDPTGVYEWNGTVQIPDGGSGTCGAEAFAEIVVTENETISGISVETRISHSFQGDIRVWLRHVESNTNVLLLDRPGLTGVHPWGFEAVNFGSTSELMRFLDSAPSIYDTPPVDFPGITSVSGDWQGIASLNVFVNESTQGTWRLVIQDCEEGFAGTLQTFRLNFNIDAPTPCYANCDNSTTEPILNVDDFTCFINAFAHAQSLTHEEQIVSYANCDNSTTAPVLNVDDFTCFINAFAQGCP